MTDKHKQQQIYTDINGLNDDIYYARLKNPTPSDIIDKIQKLLINLRLTASVLSIPTEMVYTTENKNIIFDTTLPKLISDAKQKKIIIDEL